MKRRNLTLFLFALLLAVPAFAAPIASHTGPAAGDVDRPLPDLRGNEELARVLAAHGLGPDEVEQRLAQLSDEDLEYLRANLDQVQAGGAVPKYIWIMLAVFLGVLILGAVF